jgi:hypothetical protein
MVNDKAKLLPKYAKKLILGPRVTSVRKYLILSEFHFGSKIKGDLPQGFTICSIPPQQNNSRLE